MSVDPLPENKAAQATSMHLNFPCGIIRGALLNFRIPRAVTADISNFPAFEETVEQSQLETSIQQPLFLVEEGPFPNLEDLRLELERVQSTKEDEWHWKAALNTNTLVLDGQIIIPTHNSFVEKGMLISIWNFKGGDHP
ncbi:hypothetical protein CMV_005755 [Castanea mollissima]|uniref:Uncharacterized protein n=1 Tax=Castanea mollissima TaxID=60419 RepID=A0A8J4VU18_9ROSI|nr:hypothetical protein CMV_005755 [Castanea mollissima]